MLNRSCPEQGLRRLTTPLTSKISCKSSGPLVRSRACTHTLPDLVWREAIQASKIFTGMMSSSIMASPTEDPLSSTFLVRKQLCSTNLSTSSTLTFPERSTTTRAGAPRASNCGQEFRSPASCSESNCDYYAKWSRTGNDVLVEVMNRVEDGKWTGIGFSTNPFMVRHRMTLGGVRFNGDDDDDVFFSPGLML